VGAAVSPRAGCRRPRPLPLEDDVSDLSPTPQDEEDDFEVVAHSVAEEEIPCAAAYCAMFIEEA
jgi:hypothetical protein